MRRSSTPSEVLEAGSLQHDLLPHGGTCASRTPTSRNGSVRNRQETPARSRYPALCDAPACCAPTGQRRRGLHVLARCSLPRPNQLRAGRPPPVALLLPVPREPSLPAQCCSPRHPDLSHGERARPGGVDQDHEPRELVHQPVELALRRVGDVDGLEKAAPMARPISTGSMHPSLTEPSAGPPGRASTAANTACLTA